MGLRWADEHRFRLRPDGTTLTLGLHYPSQFSEWGEGAEMHHPCQHDDGEDQARSERSGGHDAENKPLEKARKRTAFQNQESGSNRIVQDHFPPLEARIRLFAKTCLTKNLSVL